MIPYFETTYHPTANPAFLPTEFTPLTAGHGITPFGGRPFLWGRLGDLIVEALGVPVAFYSAAFGGSNLEQTAWSALGQYFSHSFVRAEIRMPYINIENTLFHLVPRTGLRAVLSAHGVNDWSSSENQFFANHKTVIDFSRQRPELANLTWMVAKSCYKEGGINQDIVNAQVRLVREVSNVFAGADLNTIGDEGRFFEEGLRLHFNELGMAMAAERWRDALINSNFQNNSNPIMPALPVKPEGSLPVSRSISKRVKVRRAK